MSETSINSVDQGVAATARVEQINIHSITLEELSKTSLKAHLDDICTRRKAEFKKLQEGQSQVLVLQKLTQLINSLKAVDNKVDTSQIAEMGEMIEAARNLGVIVPENIQQPIWDTEDKENFLENIRLTTEKFGLQNDTQMELIKRLVEHESLIYQFTRTTLKAQDEAAKASIRKIHGG